MEELDYEFCVVPVLLRGVGKRSAERQLLDIRGWVDGAEAEPELFGTAAAVSKLRRDEHLDRCVVAQNAEHFWLAVLVLHVGEQSGNAVQLDAVHADDLVAGLQAGFGCGHVRFQRLDCYRSLLVDGNEAEVFDVEVIGRAGVLHEEDGVDALAGVHVGEGQGLVQVEPRLLLHIAPVRVLDGVEVDDGVAGLKADAGCGSLGDDPVDGGRVVQVLVDLMMVSAMTVMMQKARMKLATGPASAMRMRCQRGWPLNSPSSPVGSSPGLSPDILT